MSFGQTEISKLDKREHHECVKPLTGNYYKHDGVVKLHELGALRKIECDGTYVYYRWSDGIDKSEKRYLRNQYLGEPVMRKPKPTTSS